MIRDMQTFWNYFGTDDFYDSCFTSKVDWTLDLHLFLSTLEDPQCELCSSLKICKISHYCSSR